LWYEYSGDEWFKEEAFRHFNHATYMADPDGVINVGHNWGGEVWFSDGYVDYIRHFMEGLAAIPEWVPVGNHLLKSTSIVQKIKYETNKVTFTTYDNESEVVLRLSSKPKSITVSGKALKQLNHLDGDCYVWNALDKGGFVKIKYSGGSKLEILY
jgi:hypothetical protein